MTTGVDTALARWLTQRGLIDRGLLMSCLAEVRERRWVDADVSLACLVIERRLAPAESVAEGLKCLQAEGLTAGFSASTPARTSEDAGGDVQARFGPYRVERVLARGGMGAVLHVVHEESGHHYALKTVLPSPGADEGSHEERARFAREAELSARLDHPHIVRIHAAEVSARVPYLVQDLLPGGSLAERMTKGTLEPREAAEIALKLGQALQHAHKRGVLHRDLKPNNVMFDDRGEPRLVDWGLARSLRDATLRLTEEGAVLGTPGYMPPEQAQGDLSTGPAADVYGLVALLFAMLTGRAPFQGGPLLVVLDRVLHEAPPTLRSLRPELAGRGVEFLESLVVRGLAKDPAHRPTLEEVLAGLNRVARGEHEQLESLAGGPRRGLVLGASLLVIALLGLALFSLRAASIRAEARAALAEARETLPQVEREALAYCREGARPLDAEAPRAVDLLARLTRQAPDALAPEREAERAELVAWVGELARLERARAGEPVELAETKGGGLVDALILRARGDLAGARKAASRALSDERAAPGAWIVLLGLSADHELPTLITRLGSELSPALREAALARLGPWAQAALTSYPPAGARTFDERAFNKAARPLALLRRLATREALAAIVSAALEETTPRYLVIWDASRGAARLRLLSSLAELGGESALSLGPGFERALREHVRALCAAGDEPRSGGRPITRRDALRSMVLLDRELSYASRALCPTWTTPSELVTSAVQDQIVLSKPSDYGTNVALLAVRCGHGGTELDFGSVMDKVVGSHLEALRPRVPQSRALELLAWAFARERLPRDSNHVAPEGVEAWRSSVTELLASLEELLSPESSLREDLHPSYRGEALLALAANYAQLAHGSTGAQQRTYWASAQRRARESRTLPLPNPLTAIYVSYEREAGATFALGGDTAAVWREARASLSRFKDPRQAARRRTHLALCDLGLAIAARHAAKWKDAHAALDRAEELLKRGAGASAPRARVDRERSVVVYRETKDWSAAWAALRLTDLDRLGLDEEFAWRAVEVAYHAHGSERAGRLLQHLRDMPPASVRTGVLNVRVLSRFSRDRLVERARELGVTPGPPPR